MLMPMPMPMLKQVEYPVNLPDEYQGDLQCHFVNSMNGVSNGVPGAFGDCHQNRRHLFLTSQIVKFANPAPHEH
jgi:hypothetical protein